jgi:hypothetical protein
MAFHGCRFAPILGHWETRPLKQVLDEVLSKDQPLILDA